jgi:tRNA pseudouridine55 synthase
VRRGASGINALIAVDKPEGPSSHDVVARVRRATGEGRVGHAGTLDPAASGVLVVGIGQGARLLGRITLDDKRYLARVRFGQETDTCDAEGQVVRTAEVPACVADEAFARERVGSLVGRLDQVPPAYSAISRGGVRAYDAARAGHPLELEPRSVEVLAAELVGVGPAEGGEVDWLVDLTVSKGFYVRSFARDLGRELGSCAYLAGLRRTAAGMVDERECVALDALDEGGAAAVRAAELDPVRLLGLPVRSLSEAEAADVACGRDIPVGEVGLAEGEECSLVSGRRLRGVWRRRGGRLVCSQNYPDGIEGACCHGQR